MTTGYPAPSRRYRSQGGFRNSFVCQEYASDINCVSGTFLNLTYGSVGIGVSSFMEDVVVPNFHNRVARGEVFFNHMHSGKRESSDLGGSAYAILSKTQSCVNPIKYSHWFSTGTLVPHLLKNKYGLGSSDPLPTFTSLSQSDMLSLDREIETRCLSNRVTPSSNLYEDVAERRKTLDLLRRPLNNLRRFSGSIPVARNAKHAADLWLQYRYGVMPLLRSVNTALLAAKVRRSRVRRTARAAGSIQSYTTDSFNVSQGIATISFSRVITGSYSCRAMSLDEYVTDQLYESGFSTAGLFALPWELIPYSFVVDWFVNVSDYLRALAPSPSFHHLGSCLTGKHEYTTVWTITGYVNNQPQLYTFTSGHSGSMMSRGTDKYRRTFLNPGIVIKSSSHLFDDPYVPRVLDALSLIVSRLGRSFVHLGR